MAWIAENNLKWYHKFFINILKCGPIPQHIAFIMDGNRRYAKEQHVDKIAGHSKGFDILTETLLWCKELGIKEVTVYAFSIENFKRTKDEVDNLMLLAKEKYIDLLKQKDKLQKNGVCIRLIGNLSLIPPDVRKCMLEAVLLTKDNNQTFLNVAFAYTSQDEIAHAINTVADGIKAQEIDENDVSDTLLSNLMFTSKSPTPDMLIRSSGEVRFSDFLLWQMWNTHIIFTKLLWPNFNIWHFLLAIFYYQNSYNDMQRSKNMIKFDDEELTPKASDFVKKYDEIRLKQFINYINE